MIFDPAEPWSDLEVAALELAGCSQIFTDHGLSGAEFQRPGLRRALRHLRAGDMLAGWRLDRLGCSLADLIQTVNGLSRRGCEFRSLTESIDTVIIGWTVGFSHDGRDGRLRERLSTSAQRRAWKQLEQEELG
ncbi:recombinase family protein [Rhizobium lentis]|uniref:recombinase family protein n=1 Tax=Rhizobium lentis TaxID=1138194 RepID=UPI00287FC1D9|nr:recombinase family protein [Rhizobium lentis]